MAINFPSTTGQATDGSYTYTVAGITYSWDGSSWRAAGAGASATDRTLFSVTQNAAGTAALSYNSNTGVFSYTPPDVSGYLTAEADTLATVTARGAVTTAAVEIQNTLTIGSDNVRQVTIAPGPQGKISQSNGSLILEGGGGVGGKIQAGNNTDSFIKPCDGRSAQLFYGLNDKKLETTNTGVTITGALTAGDLTYPTTNGTSGQVLTSDGAGNVSWSTPAGLQSRTTAQVTQSIANNTAANVSITTPKTYVLYSIQTSHAAWVTLYSDTASRTADASRSETTDPTPGSGVLTEVITAGAATQLITPGTICFNSAAAGTTYAKVVNKSGSTTNVTVTLTYLQLEA